MKPIRSRHITAALACAAACALFVAWGLFRHGMFAAAALCAAGYFLIDRRYLRCPSCGGFTNLDRLLYAAKHPYHCSHCGERITVE